MPEEIKKVQTFGFTREDIKEIARGEVIEYADDVVKKAIADGDIEIPEELPATTDASEGDVLKLDASKNPVWGAASGGGGTQLYRHMLQFGNNGRIFLVNNTSTTITAISDIKRNELLSLAVPFESYTGSYSGNYSSVLIYSIQSAKIVYIPISTSMSSTSELTGEFTDTVTAL